MFNRGPWQSPPIQEKTMKRLVKQVCLSLSILSLLPLSAGATNKATNSEPFDWTSVIDAIILVESEGNPKAVGGQSVGAMQITLLYANAMSFWKNVAAKSATPWQTDLMWPSQRRCSFLFSQSTIHLTTLRKQFVYGTVDRTTVYALPKDTTEKYLDV